MFEAPPDSILVAIIAFFFTILVSVLKLASRHETQPNLAFIEGFTEFPIDATSAWLSLGVGLLAAKGAFGNVMALNIVIILTCVAVQILSLKKLRSVLLSSDTSLTRLVRWASPAVSWTTLFIGLAAAVSIAKAAV